MIFKRLSVLRTLELSYFDDQSRSSRCSEQKWDGVPDRHPIINVRLIAGPANGHFDATLQPFRLRKTRRVSATQSAAIYEWDLQPIGNSLALTLQFTKWRSLPLRLVRCDLRTQVPWFETEDTLRAKQPGSGMRVFCWLQKYDEVSNSAKSLNAGSCNASSFPCKRQIPNVQSSITTIAVDSADGRG